MNARLIGALVVVSVGLYDLPLYAQEIWLEKGQIELELQSGARVTVNEGEYAKCTPDECDILPLAAAPARPEVGQTFGSSGLGGPAAGGAASGPLGGTFGAISLGVAGAAGVAGIVTGSVLGLTSSNTVTSTTGTN
jgi:hypothetical protein